MYWAKMILPHGVKNVAKINVGSCTNNQVVFEIICRHDSILSKSEFDFLIETK